jgi:hypothetical protein
MSDTASLTVTLTNVTLAQVLAMKAYILGVTIPPLGADGNGPPKVAVGTSYTHTE